MFKHEPISMEEIENANIKKEIKHLEETILNLRADILDLKKTIATKEKEGVAKKTKDASQTKAFNELLEENRK